MKKIICIIFAFILTMLCSQAETLPFDMQKNIDIQKRISNTGFKLLNANKIDKRMIFVYSNDDAAPKINKSLSKKEAVIYDKKLAFAADENELAALLSLSIGKTINSWGGFSSSANAELAPKKYQLLFDKRACDYMVKAGYNPIALITFMNKAYPEKQGLFSFLKSNKTSVRLMNIYEYIYLKYPYFIKNNPYLYSEAYQNFLLTSIDDRILLKKKLEQNYE